MLVKVKNLHGTNDNDPPVGSWKLFWEMKTGRKFSICSNVLCNEEATDGGHVIKVDSYDRSWYIVPLCKKCNNPDNRQQFTVDSKDLVKVR